MDLADIEGQLPLTETTLLILLSLAPAQKHGYAIMKDVQELSSNRIRLSTGTLYGALKRLLELGWIARVDEAAPPGSGRTLKAYELTDLGYRFLKAESSRLASLAEIARVRLVRGQP